MHMKRMVSQAGETIIEVLICIGIVGLALSISYGITNRSTLRIRAAQERSEALKYAEQQIERLKVIGPNYLDIAGTGYEFPVPDQAFSVGLGDRSFCIEADLSITPITPSALADINDPTCKLDANQQYSVGIFYDVDDADNPDNEFYIFAGRFNVNANETANGNNYEVSTLMYRMHPQQ
jgi:type II secretory pathway pseudopilin PulG